MQRINIKCISFGVNWKLFYDSLDGSDKANEINKSDGYYELNEMCIAAA